jgi:hypothetical protein
MAWEKDSFSAIGSRFAAGVEQEKGDPQEIRADA